MSMVTVSCPHCGAPVVVDCKYSGGSSCDSALCRKCGRSVHVQYTNDSFGFKIGDVY